MTMKSRRVHEYLKKKIHLGTDEDEHQVPGEEVQGLEMKTRRHDCQKNPRPEQNQVKPPHLQGRLKTPTNGRSSGDVPEACFPVGRGDITVGSSIEHAFDCDVECVEHAEALALDETLVVDLEKLANEGLDSSAKHADSFEAAKQTKEVPLDPTTPEGKTLRVSSTLDPK
jgi:hypothetical protein